MSSRDPDEPDYALLERLVEEFTATATSGEPSSIEEYAHRHPGLAELIRSAFPALSALVARAPDAPATAAGVPGRLGEYRLGRELGRGGMGVVYEAWQESLGRWVAVKILPTSALQSERARARFLREARVLARLRHPHIVPIHTVGEHEGILYYAMDLIEGCGLDQLVARSPEDHASGARSRWVARIGLQAADALAHAHEQAFLHRDIKPANFLLDAEGHLWLADFGLAWLANDGDLTSEGGFVGTLRYTAPECFHGMADERSDIYSLGLTLYELLAGRPAYPRFGRDRVPGPISRTAPLPPRQIDPSIPPDLEAVVLKASELEPADRYARATELAQDLRRFLDGAPVRVHPTGIRVHDIRRFRPRLRSFLILGAVALALASGYALHALLSGGPATATAPSRPEPASPRISPDEPSGSPAGRGLGPPPWAPGHGRGRRGGGPPGFGRGAQGP
ncbi:MAG: serine/threonine-protein kinase [Isosphaeraceae bacterium]